MPEEPPAVEFVQDCARGTLQEWLDGYTPAEEGKLMGGYRVTRLGGYPDDGWDYYRFAPADHRYTGPVYRVRVTAERVE